MPHATDVITLDDPGRPQQWGPAKIQAPLAWSAVTGTRVTGIAGVAWGTHVRPVKVLDQCGNNWRSDIAVGIVYAA